METLQEKLTRMATEPENPEIGIMSSPLISQISPFQEILGAMLNMYEAKNADYGSSFDKSCEEFGLVSPIIRMSDKLNRLKTLVKNSSGARVEDEKIEDTLMDLANYAVMTLAWLKDDLFSK